MKMSRANEEKKTKAQDGPKGGRGRAGHRLEQKQVGGRKRGQRGKIGGGWRRRSLLLTEAEVMAQSNEVDRRPVLSLS